MTTKPEKTQEGWPAMAEHEQRIREALNTDGPLSDNDLRALMSDHAAMRSALEHIRRSCQASRSQTRRVRWIEVRAYGALIGDNELHRTIDLPKDGGPDTTEKLKRQMAYDRFVAHITHGLSVGILSAMLAAHQHQAPEAMTDEQIRDLWFAATPTPDGRPASWNYARSLLAARDAMWAERLRAQPAGQDQHARDSAELRRLCQARDDARRERDVARAEIAGLESSVGHLSAMVDAQTRLAQKAVAIMKTLHESATPIVGPDMDACIPGNVFHAFVDGHAELMHALAAGPQITTPDPTYGPDPTQPAGQCERDEPEENEWRDVALRFDRHRMQALWHLQAMLKDPEAHAEAARSFIKSPPVEPTQPAGQAGGEPVGSLTVSLFRGHLENHDFDYFGKLPPGTYQLFACSTQPSGEDQVKNAQPDFMSQLYQSSIEMAAPQQQAGGEVMAKGIDTVQVYGVKDGKETLLGTAPMPARTKARELAREQFGYFEDGDGSDAELCFGALEQLIEHIERTATPAPEPKAVCIHPSWSTDEDGACTVCGGSDHEAVVATQAEPVRVPDVGRIDRSFRWDGDAQHHVPTMLVEFEPVPANSPIDAKGWKDRDALAFMLTAAQAKAQEASTAEESSVAADSSERGV